MKRKKLSDETKHKMSESKKGNKHPRWKGKIKHCDGYILILLPTHPTANKRGYILEHRLIMERHLGRTLLAKEVVHHINGDMADNRLENLMLFSGNGEHTRYHLKNKHGR